MPPPDIDLADAARLGIAVADYAEVEPAAPSHLSKGNDYTANGEFPKAIKRIYKVLKEWPDLPSALTGRASAYERIGDKIYAVRDFAQYLRMTLHPHNRRPRAVSLRG